MKVVLSVVFLWCDLMCAGAKEIGRLLPSQSRLKIEWGVSGRKGKRPAMEDAYAMQSENGQVLFSLYDGHRGCEAAYTASCNLPAYIFAQGERKAYCNVDTLLKQSGYVSGTTAVTARIVPQLNGTYKLLLAWVGDSRAFLVSDQGYIRLSTVDHKPNNPCEYVRVKAAGGRVSEKLHILLSGEPTTMARVSHPSMPRRSLSLTRALGDADWSNEIISREPETVSCPLEPGEDAYLILACDGVWDTVSSPDAADCVSKAYALLDSMSDEEIAPLIDDNEASDRDSKGTHEAGSAVAAILAARALRDRAYMLGSSDNITAMVVRLLWEQNEECKLPIKQESICPDKIEGNECCIL